MTVVEVRRPGNPSAGNLGRVISRCSVAGDDQPVGVLTTAIAS
jgi:hypothetical protein